jgi:hypothetical protein
MILSGHLDLCGPALIEGWLYSDAGSPITLQVFVGDELLGEVVADRYRDDLEGAGYGDGRCGFSFQIPEHVEGLVFDETRLRLLDAPVYLMPSDTTVIASY